MNNQALPKLLLLIMGLAAFSAVIALTGIVQLSSLNKPALSQSPIKITRNRAPANPLIIDVEGAVEKPGVYELKANSRLLDAIKKAGGLSSSADRYLIAKTYNLAKKLADEEKVYMPFWEERDSNVLGTFTSDLTYINSASLTQLELLPGIGPVRAQKIIDSRPYSQLEELISKKVLGEATFAKLSGLIGL